MENEKSNGRAWTWTPPPAMNWLMTTILRLPLIHRLVSKVLLLMTFEGKKTGKIYTIPLGYHHDDATVIILTKRFRKWWRNFETAIPVTLRIEGHNYTGSAQSLTDTETIVPIIAEVVEVHPREAEIYEIKLLENGKADMDSVRELTPKVVIIQVCLDTERRSEGK